MGLDAFGAFPLCVRQGGHGRYTIGFDHGDRYDECLRADPQPVPTWEVARFRDALIHVGYLEGITIKKRLSVVPEVVDTLLQHSENSWGYISVPHNLRKVLAEISVSRGVSDGPAFGVMEMTEHTEEIFIQIEKKCKKKYSSEHSIELLAHYTSQPSSNSFDWQSGFHDYVLRNLSGCPFERVWVYDHWSKAIKYVYPDLDKGSRT